VVASQLTSRRSSLAAPNRRGSERMRDDARPSLSLALCVSVCLCLFPSCSHLVPREYFPPAAVVSCVRVRVRRCAACVSASVECNTTRCASVSRQQRTAAPAVIPELPSTSLPIYFRR
jgi:hypothetical protein